MRQMNKFKLGDKKGWRVKSSIADTTYFCSLLP